MTLRFIENRMIHYSAWY